MAALLASCATHDRRNYTTHRDKNLHTPNVWAPSPNKAADDATASMGIAPEPANTNDSMTPPGEPPAGGQ
jgi:hypothetical protein